MFATTVHATGLQLVAQLQAGGVACSLETQPGHGTPLTSVFLKDKKLRLYIITSLASTKVDLKVLSSRLGLGKGGIKAANDEEAAAVLGGAVTPLASVSGLVLLLDSKAMGEGSVTVASLAPGARMSFPTPAALQAAIKIITSAEAIVVDLEAEPKIDRENPPDLAQYLPEPPAKPADAAGDAKEKEAPAGAGAGASKPAAGAAGGGAPKEKASGKAGKGGAGPAPAVDAAAAEAAKMRALSDVDARTEQVLEHIARTLLGTGLSECAAVQDPYTLQRLRADVAMQLNSLKNAAYAQGYVAGKGEVVAYAEKRFA
ncbi:hypothetical protein FOA52_000602 [Chlamydomonas sp. UWO 241]|nr:hypothetical protein FOA52_000602 [Chlamydomonas sp. UWO 241]